MKLQDFVLKAPPTVKAVQFEGGITPAHDIIVWVEENGGYGLSRKFGRAGWDDGEPNTEHLCIMDKENRMYLEVGDWIVCLGDNWFETLTDEEFNRKYDLAKE